jgi:hypothetical protein
VQEVENRCCRKIGGEEWGARPEEGFLTSVNAVYKELARSHLQEKRLSLRGHEEEKGIVMGLWAMAVWRREGSPSTEGVALKKKTSGGWSSGSE